MLSSFLIMELTLWFSDCAQLQSKREMFFKSETLPTGSSVSGNVTTSASASAIGASTQPVTVGSIATLKESLLANKENHTTTAATTVGPQTSSSSTTLTGSSSSSNNSSNSSVPGLATSGSKVCFVYLLLSFFLFYPTLICGDSQVIDCSIGNN